MSTQCYAYFEIRSDGYFDVEKGYVASPDSDFDLEYITKTLEIEPSKTVKMGMPRECGIGKYPFTKWIFQPEPEADDPTLCMSIVRALKEKIPLLQDIHTKLNVDFAIQVVAHIVDDETAPYYGFDDEVIEFCYLTYTDIGLDWNISTKE